MMKKNSLSLCLAGSLWLLTVTAQAMPTHEVIFVKGSNCGTYQGDLTSGALFSMEMNANQQLVISTDGHVQSVTDSQGEVLEDKGGANYRYDSKHTSTHTIKMVGRIDSAVEFCVY